MKVLFLDCDGVLNSRTTFINEPGTHDPLDKDMVKRVNRIIKETGCKVVLSSTWRKSEYSMSKVAKKIKLYDVTPDFSMFRGDEVKKWVDLHDIEKYACLDDDSDFYPDQHLFKTSFDLGLIEEITQKVIDYLK